MPAGGTLIMVFYVGLIVGPTLAAAFIDRLGGPGLFHCILLVQGLTALTGLLRLVGVQGRARSPGTALAYGASSTTGASRLDPEAERAPSYRSGP